MRLLPIVLLAAACAAEPPRPLPAYYRDARAEHPAFPHARYLAGVGLSTVSAGDADQRARAEVSAQISARLESETSSFQRYTSASGDTAEAVTSRVSVRTSFDRADLIRIVEREARDGTWYSFAALDRAGADRELAQGMSADLARFVAAARSATRARAAGESGVFLSAAAEAAKTREKLDAAFIVRRAVAGHPAPEEADYVASRNQLLALLEEARARRVVGVVVHNPGGARLIDFAVNAVKRLGLRPDGATCDKRDRRDLADATELEVEPEERCSEGSLGERCEITVRLVAQACAGGTSGAGTVAAVRGVHPSDRDKARRSAWEKVTPQAVEAAVREALGSALQIGE